MLSNMFIPRTFQWTGSVFTNLKKRTFIKNLDYFKQLYTMRFLNVQKIFVTVCNK